MMTDNRLKKLRREMAAAGIDAALISQPENRYYLSGFKGSAGYLLISRDRAVLATDFRYTEQAGAQAPGYEIIKISGSPNQWLLELVSGLRPPRLGFEEDFTTAAWYRQTSEILSRQSPKPRLVPIDGIISALRAVKEPEEVELISRASAISDAALAYAEEILRPGISEQQMAWELEKFMREHGSEALPFDIIVASGPNAAMPHAQPSPRIIAAGEPVLIDMGARAGGYCSDLSRTLFTGKPDSALSQIYSTVLDAQHTAMSIIKEGISGEQADLAARKVIEKAGYGEAFGHSLGHGVGLAPHEVPRLGPGAGDLLANGMVFTIEPGIYLPGYGGVRIEDLAIMENGRARAISKARKD